MGKSYMKNIRPKNMLCQADIKNFSGCMCSGCEKWSKTGPWIVGVHGHPKEDLIFKTKNFIKEYGPYNFSEILREIFVARKNNKHAFKSWGWAGLKYGKLMILDGTCLNYKIWNHLYKKAQQIAKLFNETNNPY